MNESFSNLLADLANWKTVFVAGAATFSLFSAGLTPRIGFVRALVLAGKSLFPRKLKTESVRTREIDTLKKTIASLQYGQYLVVTGGKGFGKSCLIETTLHKQLSVIKILVKSGEDKDKIVEKVEQNITNLRNSFFDISFNSKRVLYFHRAIFGFEPIVVIVVPERFNDAPYADITAAVRELADPTNGNGLRVIVDSSPNSLQPGLKTTTREWIIEVEPMERTALENICEFKRLMLILRKNHLSDIVWTVFGGTPSHYNALQSITVQHGEADDGILVEALKKFMHLHMVKMLNTITKSSENTQKIISKFRTENKKKISNPELASASLLLESPNEVFREIFDGVDICVVAANPTIEIIITKNISNGTQLAAYLENLYLQQVK